MASANPELAFIQIAAVGALTVIMTALTLLACWYVSSTVFQTLVNRILSHVPLVGRFLKSATDSIIGAVNNAIVGWLVPHLRSLVQWLTGLADRFTDFPDAIADFAARVEAAVEHLVKVKIGEIVQVITDPLDAFEHATRTRLNDLRDDLETLREGLPVRFEAVREWAHDHILVPLKTEITELRTYVDSAVVPALKELLRQTRDDLEVGVATVAADLSVTEQALQAQAQRIDLPVSLLEGLIATVGLQAAAEAVDTLGRCSPKMRQVCTTDPGAWANFIAGLALLGLWPGLVEITRETQTILGDVAGELAQLIEHGL